MSPLLIVSLVLGALLACGGSFWYGTEVGADGVIASQKKTDDLVREVTAAALTGAATAIAANQPINKTIVQKVQHEVQTNTVYAECKHTAAGLRGINEALTGRPQPAGDSKLPGAVAPN
jgi:hypothetical protein